MKGETFFFSKGWTGIECSILANTWRPVEIKLTLFGLIRGKIDTMPLLFFSISFFLCVYDPCAGSMNKIESDFSRLEVLVAEREQ